MTPRILTFLYPQVKVFGHGFEATALPRDYFDLALSNIPFGRLPVHDPGIKDRYLKAAIHDYYFARSLRLVKPGGIIAFITSRYTLDKMNPRVRRHIAEHAELLAAARLPEGAFRKNAGTGVVTDVVILRKRTAPVVVDDKLSWIGTDAFPNEADYRIPVNRLYIERPELMLGVPVCSRGMYGDFEFTLKPDGRDLAEALRDALISQSPANVITPALMIQSSSFEEEGLEEEKASVVDLGRLAEAQRGRAAALLDIYTAAKQAPRLQLLDADDEKLAEAQRELNHLYLRFTAQYGYINAKQNLKDLDRRSPIVPFLKALEEPAGQKNDGCCAESSDRAVGSRSAAALPEYQSPRAGERRPERIAAWRADVAHLDRKF